MADEDVLGQVHKDDDEQLIFHDWACQATAPDWKASMAEDFAAFHSSRRSDQSANISIRAEKI